MDKKRRAAKARAAKARAAKARAAMAPEARARATRSRRATTRTAMTRVGTSRTAMSEAEQDAISCLRQLGMRAHEARRAVAYTGDAADVPLEERVRAALVFHGRRLAPARINLGGP